MLAIVFQGNAERVQLRQALLSSAALVYSAFGGPLREGLTNALLAEVGAVELHRGRQEV